MGKDKSSWWSDDQELDDGVKRVKNLVAFVAHKDGSCKSFDSDVDTNAEEYHVVHDK